MFLSNLYPNVFYVSWISAFAYVLVAGAGIRGGRRCSALRPVVGGAGRGPGKNVVDAGDLSRDLHAWPWHCSPWPQTGESTAHGRPSHDQDLWFRLRPTKDRKLFFCIRNLLLYTTENRNRIYCPRVYKRQKSRRYRAGRSLTPTAMQVLCKRMCSFHSLGISNSVAMGHNTQHCLICSKRSHCRYDLECCWRSFQLWQNFWGPISNNVL